MPVVMDVPIYCLGNRARVSENEFREEKVVPLVGEVRSYDIIDTIRFIGFLVVNHPELRKQVVHFDNCGKSYVIVDAFDVDAKVYVDVCERTIYITNIIL